MSPSSLLLLRHGKSDQDAGPDDHARPLRPRGRRAAQLTGRFLRSNGLVPDLCLCSSAVRTRQTAEEVLAAGGFDTPLELRDDLYLAPAGTLLEHLQNLPGRLERVLVIGHEPGLSQLLGRLSGGPPPRFPTACLAHLAVGCDSWAGLGPGRAGLELLLPPRALQAFADDLPGA